MPATSRSRIYVPAAEEESGSTRGRVWPQKNILEAPMQRTRSRIRERPSVRSMDSASSSPTSDASSVFDRFRDRTAASSTRTSLDSNGSDKYKPAKNGMPAWVGNDDEYKLDDAGLSMPIHPSFLALSPSAEEQQSTNTAADFGARLWSRVTEAAGALSISVGQAWTSNVTTYSGEVTPPGGESHLTRAMKAYHLSKAKSQAELPDWLFTEQERGIRASRRAAWEDVKEDRHGDYARGDHSHRAARSARGVADVYPSANASLAAPPTRSEPDLYHAPTKASDRLRAIRDAKRGATMRSGAASSAPTSASVDSPRESGERRWGRGDVYGTEDGFSREVPLPARPPVRVGLPSRPGMTRRI
ncbi:hypothetical protein K488DRAFT_87479 [Vararia minispora EC-137]|uniref:Uncharacterized protein n=1 Tax=Vararia minispora EC-137 TaxID=1314806 RepID=A0ACB8QG78_9AGAM|nr:hypothetical protein K488DRAFT_87479 [Vararia minispora EC-137]